MANYYIIPYKEQSDGEYEICAELEEADLFEVTMKIEKSHNSQWLADFRYQDDAITFAKAKMTEGDNLFGFRFSNTNLDN